MKKNANKGFSLVELIIVIAIMAVLIGVLAPQFIKHVENSRQSTDMDNLQAVKTAMEAAYADESLTTAKSISVKGGASGYISVDADTATACDGVIASTTLKSSGWNSGMWTYQVSGTSAYTWSSKGACTNSKGNKNNDMDTIFK